VTRWQRWTEIRCTGLQRPSHDVASLAMSGEPSDVRLTGAQPKSCVDVLVLPTDATHFQLRNHRPWHNNYKLCMHRLTCFSFTGFNLCQTYFVLLFRWVLHVCVPHCLVNISATLFSLIRLSYCHRYCVTCFRVSNVNNTFTTAKSRTYFCP